LTYFITLEGPEGCGKSTQAVTLCAEMKRRGYDVLHTREPGGTPIGEQIRRVLMDLENTSMLPRVEVLLFSASRAQHVRDVILPHLQQGGVVVCDRFYDSTLAYQGYGHGLDVEALRTITAFATDGLVPDLTLLLDLPIEDGLLRKQNEGEWNRLDAYDLPFHRRVREGYLQLAEAEPERWHRVDASHTIDDVQEAIQEIVFQRLT